MLEHVVVVPGFFESTWCGKYILVLVERYFVVLIVLDGLEECVKMGKHLRVDGGKAEIESCSGSVAVEKKGVISIVKNMMRCIR